jgi:O-methyltransferase involved in polyketide biosynthesis
MAEVLPSRGFDPQATVFVSWLGTIFYLTYGAIGRVTGSIRNAAVVRTSVPEEP